MHHSCQTSLVIHVHSSGDAIPCTNSQGHSILGSPGKVACTIPTVMADYCLNHLPQAREPQSECVSLAPLKGCTVAAGQHDRAAAVLVPFKLKEHCGISSSALDIAGVDNYLHKHDSGLLRGSSALIQRSAKNSISCGLHREVDRRVGDRYIHRDCCKLASTTHPPTLYVTSSSRGSLEEAGNTLRWPSATQSRHTKNHVAPEDLLVTSTCSQCQPLDRCRQGGQQTHTEMSYQASAQPLLLACAARMLMRQACEAGVGVRLTVATFVSTLLRVPLQASPTLPVCQMCSSCSSPQSAAKRLKLSIAARLKLEGVVGRRSAPLAPWLP